MIILVRKKFLYSSAAALLLAFILCNLALIPAAIPSLAVQNSMEKPLFILDAGHGGEDGGAVAADGTIESEINLAIVKKLDALLRFAGKETLLTRADENAIYSPEAVTLREKKRSDLKNRVEIVNATENGVLISIHQNSLPSDVRVRGAQVFYSTVPGSEELGEAVQLALNETINCGNEKSKKQIPESVYLMKHAACPAILVECGFLSNAEETKLLCSAEYQMKLALAITAGLL